MGRRGGVLPEAVGVAGGKGGQATVRVADGGTVGACLPCRNDGPLAYSGDDEAGLGWSMAWFDANSGRHDARRGQKRPNAWGLYDMYGNVWEWCQDWYDKRLLCEVADRRSGRTSRGWNRVLRGGSWFRPARYCRSAFRTRLRARVPRRRPGLPRLPRFDRKAGRREPARDRRSPPSSRPAQTEVAPSPTSESQSRRLAMESPRRSLPAVAPLDAEKAKATSGPLGEVPESAARVRPTRSG